MASIRDELAKNFLYYRKRSGYTQKQLAEMLGVKNTAVSNWESGKNSIDIDTLVLACSIFGVTLDEMYGQISDRSSMRSLTSDEAELLDKYNMMNDEGKQKILSLCDDLVTSEKYKKILSVSNG